MKGQLHTQIKVVAASICFDRAACTCRFSASPQQNTLQKGILQTLPSQDNDLWDGMEGILEAQVG